MSRRGSAAAMALVLWLAGCDEAAVGTGDLQGQVLLRGEVEPVAVPVDIEGPQSARVLTDVSGHFVATGLAPGTYAITASLGLWSVQSVVSASVQVRAGAVAVVPTLELTPAGAITGQVEVAPGAGADRVSASGFRIQVLGSDMSAVSDARGAFAFYRVPPGVYELLAESATVGAGRRAGVEVLPLAATHASIVVRPGDDAQSNEHPRFTVEAVQVTGNATPVETAAAVPLPYRVAPGRVRRFDIVRLEAPAEDPNGDRLSYEWSVSAGRLDDALSAVALWQPDATAGSAASLSVTVRDGHGGVTRLSTDVEIVDIFAGSAHRDGERVVHSYRIEGSPWHVDLVDLSTDTSERLVTLEGPDPCPLLVDAGVVYRRGINLIYLDETTGQRRTLEVVPASIDVDDSVTPPRHLPNRAVQAAGGRLLLVTEARTDVVMALEPRTGSADGTVPCVLNCEAFAVRGSEVVARGPDASGATAYFFGAVGNSAAAIATFAAVGTGLAAAGSGRFAYVAGGVGRGSRGTVMLFDTASGANQAEQVYAGYYELWLWAADGDDLYITEQEYRALRHPPFVRLVRVGSGAVGRFPGPDDGAWQADRVYDVRDGVALLRRLAAADWPEDADDSRSEIVRVRVEREFQ